MVISKEEIPSESLRPSGDSAFSLWRLQRASLYLPFRELRPPGAHPPPSETLAQLTPEALGRGQESRKATQDTSFYDHKQSGKGVAGRVGHWFPVVATL